MIDAERINAIKLEKHSSISLLGSSFRTESQMQQQQSLK